MAKSAVYGFRVFGAAPLKLTVVLNSGQFISTINRVSGKFQTGVFRHAVTDVNDRAARFVQQGMAIRVKEKVAETGRPQRGDNRLEISILSPENYEATVSGFRVGRKSWLERSPAALYYRRIEEGDPHTYGAYVLFSDGGSRTFGPFSPGGGNRKKQLGQSYPNRKMIQHVGVWVPNIGPYPAYHYTEGGRDYLRKFDIRQKYVEELTRVGIPISQYRRRRKK